MYDQRLRDKHQNEAKKDAALGIDPDPQLECEADEAAEAALQGEAPLVINRMESEGRVQRFGGVMPVAPAGGLLGKNEDFNRAVRNRFARHTLSHTRRALITRPRTGGRVSDSL